MQLAEEGLGCGVQSLLGSGQAAKAGLALESVTDGDAQQDPLPLLLLVKAKIRAADPSGALRYARSACP